MVGDLGGAVGWHVAHRDALGRGCVAIDAVIAGAHADDAATALKLGDDLGIEQGTDALNHDDLGLTGDLDGTVGCSDLMRLPHGAHAGQERRLVAQRRKKLGIVLEQHYSGRI